MIEFERKQPKNPKVQLVRFDEETDERLREIAKTEGTALVEVVRTFVKIGLSVYDKANGNK